MSDPERLLSGGTEFERELLAGAQVERPGAALSRRMAVGIGVGGALGYTAMAKAMASTWWGKALIGTVVGTAVATSVVMSGGDAAPTKQSEAPAVAPQIALPVAEAEAPAKPETETETTAETETETTAETNTVEEATSLEQVGETKSLVTRPRAQAPAKKSTLSEEIRLIDQARALVNGGKQGQALSVLDRYSRKFPAGVLKHEAGVLRAQAQKGLQ